MEIVLGALSSLNLKLGELIIGEYNLRKGVKGEIKFILEKLESFKASLHDISKTPPDQIDKSTKDWSREVRELSYDIESSVDRFMVRCKANKQAGHHGFKEVIKTKVDLLIQPIIHHNFAAEIRNIKSRIHELDNRCPEYKIKDAPLEHITVDPRIHALYMDQSMLVGIDSAKAEVLKIMLEGNEPSMQQGKIVSIVGFGGLGKTTLANVVYAELGETFDCDAFVSVSQTPNMGSILNSMLDQLSKYKKRETLDLLQSIVELRKFLQHKRYLVVIDDIWNVSSWETIRCALPDNDCGYGIIITTRILSIANYAGGAYKIRPLSLSDSRRLFYSRTIIKDTCPEELLEVSEKILEKCDGVPLAITTVARLLAVKEANKMEWCRVNSSFGTGDLGMRDIMLLSYNDLPSHLKTCLLYLNVFPKGYKIDKARLIWMWIAEGFIPITRENGLFELGEKYLDELINRNMIQPVYNNGMIEHCHVQNMVLDLIHHLSSEENIVTILSDEYGTPSERVRRLSLQSGKEDRTIIQTTRSIMQQVRSAIVFPSAADRMPAFESLRDLCVLDLNDCDLSQGLSLKYLGSLFYLKYLGLSNTRIAQLPEEIGNLQFLQTLNVKCNEIGNMPSTMVHLKQLMCLQIDMDTRVPNGIAKLTSLEELSQIGIYDSAGIEALCCLMELRVLHIACHTECMDSLEKSLVDCLCKLQKVQNLSIWVASGECKLDALVVPQHLCRLSLHGCWFSTLPDWVNPSSLKNISSISIALIELQEKDLKNLGMMPALCYLNLKVDHENLGVLQRFIIDASSFQRLLSCELWGFRGPVIYTQGAMPRLTSLRFTLHVRNMGEISGSSNGGYNLGIQNLVSLQDVTVLLRCGGASNLDVQQVKAALRHATKIHPNHPTVDFIGYEDQDEMVDWT